jgi:hypothetical protein
MAAVTGTLVETLSQAGRVPVTTLFTGAPVHDKD